MSKATHDGVCAFCETQVSNESSICPTCNAVWVEDRAIMERAFYLIPAFVAGFLAVVVFMGFWSLLDLGKTEYSDWLGAGSAVTYFIAFISAFIWFDIKRIKTGHWDKTKKK